MHSFAPLTTLAMSKLAMSKFLRATKHNHKRDGIIKSGKLHFKE